MVLGTSPPSNQVLFARPSRKSSSGSGVVLAEALRKCLGIMQALQQEQLLRSAPQKLHVVLRVAGYIVILGRSHICDNLVARASWEDHGHPPAPGQRFLTGTPVRGHATGRPRWTSERHWFRHRPCVRDARACSDIKPARGLWEYGEVVGPPPREPQVKVQPLVSTRTSTCTSLCGRGEGTRAKPSSRLAMNPGHALDGQVSCKEDVCSIVPWVAVLPHIIIGDTLRRPLR